MRHVLSLLMVLVLCGWTPSTRQELMELVDNATNIAYYVRMNGYNSTGTFMRPVPLKEVLATLGLEREDALRAIEAHEKLYAAHLWQDGTITRELYVGINFKNNDRSI